MHFVHPANPPRYNILSIILSLVCAPFSLGSIWKYWISIYEARSSLKHIEQIWKCALSKEPDVFMVLPFTIKTKKIQQTIPETFTKKNLLWNLTRLHGGLFELKILEIFTAAFLLKTIIWSWVLSLKTKKKYFSQKRCKSPKNCLI